MKLIFLSNLLIFILFNVVSFKQIGAEISSNQEKNLEESKDEEIIFSIKQEAIDEIGKAALNYLFDDNNHWKELAKSISRIDFSKCGNESDFHVKQVNILKLRKPDHFSLKMLKNGEIELLIKGVKFDSVSEFRNYRLPVPLVNKFLMVKNGTLRLNAEDADIKIIVAPEVYSSPSSFPKLKFSKFKVQLDFKRRWHFLIYEQVKNKPQRILNWSIRFLNFFKAFVPLMERSIENAAIHLKSLNGFLEKFSFQYLDILQEKFGISLEGLFEITKYSLKVDDTGLEFSLSVKDMERVGMKQTHAKKRLTFFHKIKEKFGNLMKRIKNLFARLFGKSQSEE